MSKEFEPLYATDKNGKTKEWNIRVDNHNTHSKIVYSYGYIDGKKTIYELEISKGKNIGKKNETTHYQQALTDAESRWKKKMTIDGYSPFKNKDESSEVSESLSPMLAHDYNKHSKKVEFPCFIQPKLDGYRMVYNSKDKKMYSRNGKEYSILQGTNLHEELGRINVNLDGELYIHNNLKFEDYGVLRKKKLSKEDEKVLENMEYHVYDVIIEEDYHQRHKILSMITVHTDLIKLVPTYMCNNKEDIETYHSRFISEGYEGSMIRNYNGLYMQKYRSYNLLKYKNFDDAEYKIIDYTYENDVLGKNDKVIVWICKTREGKTFNVPSKGTREERNKLYEDGKEYIGKMLSVQYFGLTNDGIPRFPKTLREGRSSIREE